MTKKHDPIQNGEKKAILGIEAWPFLKEGDVIDVIAPSSPPRNPPPHIYEMLYAYFAKTPFKLNIPEGMIEPTSPLEEANTIPKRVEFIREAFASDSKAVWAIGGGAWGVNLLEALSHLPKPEIIKPIIGYSDTTALHVLSNQFWGFPSLHSVVLGINGDIPPAWNKTGIKETLDVLSGETPTLSYPLSPVNTAAQEMPRLDGKIVGGNTLLTFALSGSDDFTLNSKGKFVFLESIADGPGRFSRKLNGAAFSKLIKECEAVIFGDIIEVGGKENPPLVQEQFDFIIQRFANQFASGKPVLQAYNLFGHGPRNLPLPLNTLASLERQGENVTLTVSANRV